jgi:hypothetical protein
MEQGQHAQCPLIVGWKEYLDFPDWGIYRLKAKVDTGARTSALDARYTIHKTPAGLVAELQLPLGKRPGGRVAVVRAPVVGMVRVSNSGGMREERPLIETTLQLGPVTKRIRLTVTSRASMLFRVILGRKALEGDFLVDVSRKYLCGKRRDSGSGEGSPRKAGLQPRTPDR